MATQDLTVGGSAQPYNGHSPVSVVPFEYDATVNAAASGDDLKLLALPVGALVLGVDITISSAEGTDTADFGFAAAGTTIANSTTITAGTIQFATPTYIGTTTGGIWMHTDAAFSTCVLTGKVAVVYANLDPQP